MSIAAFKNMLTFAVDKKWHILTLPCTSACNEVFTVCGLAHKARPVGCDVRHTCVYYYVPILCNIPNL